MNDEVEAMKEMLSLMCERRRMGRVWKEKI